MKRRVVAVLAAVVTGLAAVVAGLTPVAVPAAARDGQGSQSSGSSWEGQDGQDGHGNIERNEWNIPLTNLRVL